MGLAVCRHFAGRGDRVAVLDINSDAAEQLAEELRDKGAAALACPVDVADRESVFQAVDKARAELGPIEIAVTCARHRVVRGVHGDLARDVEPRDRHQPRGHVLLRSGGDSGHGCRPMGRIVTVSSSGAQHGAPRGAHYVASKGGVIALTKAVAREFASFGITANTIPPGMIDTPMAQKARADGEIPSLEVTVAAIPVGRAETADDIAAACASLCSDDAGYITGQIIGANGRTYM